MADGVAAVDEDAGQAVLEVEIVLAEDAALHVEQLADELVDALQVLGGRVVGLLEEVLRRVLDGLHLTEFNLYLYLFIARWFENEQI